MRLILSTIIGLFFFTAVSTAQNNPQAEEVLDNVSNFYSNFYSFTGTFVMKIENEEADISEIQEGEYWVMGDKYRLESKMLDRVTDGETVWTIFKEDEELQITDFDPEEEEFNPSSLYTLYKNGFTYPNFTDTLLYGGQMSVIDLYPTSDEESYEKITLLVTKRNFVATGIVYSKNGTIVTYEIGNFTAYNEKETDATKFQYDATEYEGLDLDVIDLR